MQGLQPFDLSVDISPEVLLVLIASSISFFDFVFTKKEIGGGLRMLGEFVTRGLILVLGYAYPAFECFKTVEKNRVEMHELRFWCQYWIIVAVLTVFDSIGDMLMSWLPIYGELKLALIIYLWYPKTKGTGYVYETLLRPYVAMREHDIDRSLQELRVRVWDLALYYWQNFSSLGQTKFFEIVQFITSQLGKITKSNNETADQHLEKLANQFQLKNERHNPEPSAPPLSPPRSSSFNFFSNRKQPSDHRRRPPMPPPSPGRVYRSVAQPPKSNVVQVHLHNQTEYVHTLTHEELDMADYGSGSGSPGESDTVINRRLNGTKFRFRRS